MRIIKEKAGVWWIAQTCPNGAPHQIWRDSEPGPNGRINSKLSSDYHMHVKAFFQHLLHTVHGHTCRQTTHTHKTKRKLRPGGRYSCYPQHGKVSRRVECWRLPILWIHISNLYREIGISLCYQDSQKQKAPLTQTKQKKKRKTKTQLIFKDEKYVFLKCKFTLKIHIVLYIRIYLSILNVVYIFLSGMWIPFCLATVLETSGPCTC